MINSCSLTSSAPTSLSSLAPSPGRLLTHTVEEVTGTQTDSLGLQEEHCPGGEAETRITQTAGFFYFCT